MFGQRILVAIPHPDDEVVACAAAIARAREEGAEVFALYLTHGCIAEDTLWPWQRTKYASFVATRHQEAEQVAAFLEITPIGWPSRPARHLWRELSQVYAELETAIMQYDIDQLWVPAYEGGNADHDGLNAVAQMIDKKNKANNREPLSILEFAEYNFFGGKARSQAFPYPNGTEQTLVLSSEERIKKTDALSLYASEKLNLNYVKAERECWRPLASYDYSKPPHPGTLWYARFQWVPFRHPRVDFTRPANVSGAIVNFMKTQG